MSKHADSVGWISLMDYATRKGVSLSTLRRHIKANKVLYKVENGRYLLFCGSEDTEPVAARKTDETAATVRLETDLMKAQEEIVELKTLIAFYEEQLPKQTLNH